MMDWHAAVAAIELCAIYLIMATLCFLRFSLQCSRCRPQRQQKPAVFNTGHDTHCIDCNLHKLRVLLQHCCCCCCKSTFLSSSSSSLSFSFGSRFCKLPLRLRRVFSLLQGESIEFEPKVGYLPLFRRFWVGAIVAVALFDRWLVGSHVSFILSLSPSAMAFFIYIFLLVRLRQYRTRGAAVSNAKGEGEGEGRRRRWEGKRRTRRRRKEGEKSGAVQNRVVQ